MNHDPLCVEPQTDYPCKRCWEIECECLCICDILAKVREDERAAAGDRISALLSGDFYGTAGFLTYFALYRKYVIAAASDDRETLRALQEKS